MLFRFGVQYTANTCTIKSGSYNVESSDIENEKFSELSDFESDKLDDDKQPEGHGERFKVDQSYDYLPQVTHYYNIFISLYCVYFVYYYNKTFEHWQIMH